LCQEIRILSLASRRYRSKVNPKRVGEIGNGEKGEFVDNASASITPVDWPEPLGLAMIEAMACGTPAITRHRGSAPETIGDSIVGFAVGDPLQPVIAVQRLARLGRRHTRRVLDERFSARRMA
jgi:glycosyltransferase involved in cell wall biosynthesis